MNKWTRYLMLSTLLLLSGCGLISGKKEIRDADLVKTSYQAADALVKNAPQLQLYQSRPILVASFVDIDDVQRSSTFGRMIAEQVGSRLAQHGYKVIEVKVRTDTIFTKGNAYSSEGEYLLSRELQDISRHHDAYALVAGTYGAGKEVVYVTTKLIRAQDNIIMSSYDYSLPVGDNTRNLLKAATASRR